MTGKQIMMAELAWVIVLLLVAAVAMDYAEQNEPELLPRLDKPPIIVLSEETRAYTFPSGSAELSDIFMKRLGGILNQIEDLALEYKCDKIEVVGHTDGQNVVMSKTNLDQELLGFIEGQYLRLDCSDNAGLGLMRAVAVTNFLCQRQAEGWLQMIKVIHPLSAGQVILPGGSLAPSKDKEDNPSRRRIEIRLLRSEG